MIWKTVGDEILFCCRVYSAQHSIVCVRSFLDALEEYGSYLEASTDGALDVKGSGWLAAFPAPNITILLPGRPKVADEGDEAFEDAADKEPSSYDFLGQNIDAGFRTCRNAAGDHFSLSVELAYILTKHAGKTDNFPFAYHGRQSFKGVINNRPYPVVTIITERKQDRIHVRNKERRITNDPVIENNDISDFLYAFMEDEGIERPQLKADASDQSILYKASAYSMYEEIWAGDRKEDSQREALLASAESKDDGTLDVMPDEIERAATQIIAAAPDAGDKH